MNSITTSKRASGVQLALSCHVSLISLLRSREDAYVKHAPRMRNGGPELGVARRDAEKAGLVPDRRLANVLSVHLTRNTPQIGNPVVLGITVDVIDLKGRPISKHIKPCQAMTQV